MRQFKAIMKQEMIDIRREIEDSFEKNVVDKIRYAVADDFWEKFDEQNKVVNDNIKKYRQSNKITQNMLI